MALRGVVFDVGETLMDETRLWERAADAVGVPRFTLVSLLGALVGRGERHDRVWEVLEVERPSVGWDGDDFYEDAIPCLERLRGRGLLVGAAGNTSEATEELLRRHVDVVGSSGRWGVEKPESAFFARVVTETRLEPGEIAYVGDRVDNDVEPALAAGMTAVHLRRGPWGYLHQPPPEALRVRSLAELPEALGV